MINNASSESRGINIITLGKNVLICFILSIVLLFALSGAAVIFTFPEAVCSLCVNAITYLSVGICGFLCSRHSGSSGLLTGALLGLVYSLILYLAGCLIYTKFSFGVPALLTIIVCVLSGAVGGIIGVNTKRKRRKSR